MAIKFSQFVVQTDASTLSHIVGYDGVDNIQITPTNFLNSLLTGTAGQVLYYDTTGVAGENAFFWDNTNKRLGIGTNTPSYKVHIKDNSVTTGSKTLLQLQSDPINNGGSLNLDFRVSSANADDRYVARISGMREGSGALSQLQFWTESAGLNQRMTITSAGNVGIGTATPTSKLEVDGDMSVTPGGVILLPDSSFLRFGTGGDATIYHDALDTYFKNFTGDLIIQNNKDDRDIIFQTDDGSGGVTTYFYLDGSDTLTRFNKRLRMSDAVGLQLGSSGNFEMYHFNGNTTMDNFTGNLTIRNSSNGNDISFACDDGSGGATEYFRLDGGGVLTFFSKPIQIADNQSIFVGDGGDLKIYNDGSNSYIDNISNHLVIQNQSANKDIIFKNDDGGGGLITYFLLDGSLAAGSVPVTRFPDNSKLGFGDSTDLQIYHGGTNSVIDNLAGDLIVTNFQDDGDIKFLSDDGSGGATEYFKLDGGNTNIKFSKDLYLLDNVKARIGTGSDLQLLHNSTDSLILNYTGDFYISNQANDKDVIFTCDDGSGSTATYFFLDGSTASGGSLYTQFPDSSNLTFGAGNDLRIYHNGTNSNIENFNGTLQFVQNLNDGDIKFLCDDGSGGVTEYFRVDGGVARTIFTRNTAHVDNAKAIFGNGDDLQIYHDGNNSYIQDSGTGELKLYASSVAIQSATGNEYIAYFAGTGAQTASLYAGNVKKLETKSTGINIQGVTEYTNNTAALAAGLVVGDVYRTGDDLKIVH